MNDIGRVLDFRLEHARGQYKRAQRLKVLAHHEAVQDWDPVRREGYQRGAMKRLTHARGVLRLALEAEFTKAKAAYTEAARLTLAGDANAPARVAAAQAAVDALRAELAALDTPDA